MWSSCKLRSRDLATPTPNQLDREITQFAIEGTTFLPGDVDRDGRVDGADLLAFAPHFGARRGESRFVGFADLNADDEINGTDLAMLAVELREDRRSRPDASRSTISSGAAASSSTVKHSAKSPARRVVRRRR